jgi:hypothetical protein
VVSHPGPDRHPDVGTPTMRPSAATIALDEGIALAVVQEMLGFAGLPLYSCREAAASASTRVGDEFVTLRRPIRRPVDRLSTTSSAHAVTSSRRLRVDAAG